MRMSLAKRFHLSFAAHSAYRDVSTSSTTSTYDGTRGEATAPAPAVPTTNNERWREASEPVPTTPATDTTAPDTQTTGRVPRSAAAADRGTLPFVNPELSITTNSAEEASEPVSAEGGRTLPFNACCALLPCLACFAAEGTPRTPRATLSTPGTTEGSQGDKAQERAAHPQGTRGATRGQSSCRRGRTLEAAIRGPTTYL